MLTVASGPRAALDGHRDMAYRSCILPNQLYIFLSYAALLPISIVLFFVGRRFERRTRLGTTAGPPATTAAVSAFAALTGVMIGDKLSQDRYSSGELRRRASNPDGTPLPSPPNEPAAAGVAVWPDRRSSVAGSWRADVVQFGRMAAGLLAFYVLLLQWERWA